MVLFCAGWHQDSALCVRSQRVLSPVEEQQHWTDCFLLYLQWNLKKCCFRSLATERMWILLFATWRASVCMVFVCRVRWAFGLKYIHVFRCCAVPFVCDAFMMYSTKTRLEMYTKYCGVFWNAFCCIEATDGSIRSLLCILLAFLCSLRAPASCCFSGSALHCCSPVEADHKQISGQPCRSNGRTICTQSWVGEGDTRGEEEEEREQMLQWSCRSVWQQSGRGRCCEDMRDTGWQRDRSVSCANHTEQSWR